MNPGSTNRPRASTTRVSSCADARLPAASRAQLLEDGLEGPRQGREWPLDDMEAFYERRRMVKFKTILQEMETEDVLGALRDLSDELEEQSGTSMAQCEYWSDTMDRWAEDLVDPAGGGT